MPVLRVQNLTTQLLIVILLALLVPAAAMLYDIFFAAKTDDVLIKEMEKKLIRITNHVSQQVQSKLSTAGDAARGTTPAEVFNEVAAPLTEHYPGVRICYYDKETGDIIIHGYLHEFGKRLPEERKEREQRIYRETEAGISSVLAGGTPITRLGKTYDDQFLEHLVPLKINSATVGVIWAEQMMHPIFAQSSRVRLVLRYVIFGVFGLGVAVALLTVTGIIRGIRIIREGITEMKKNLHNKLPEMPGEMGYIAAAVNDMARELLEKEQVLDQYRRSENLLAMGRTITEIAHELRAPVSVIQATAQAMELNTRDLPQLADYVRRIEREVERHNKLINELLAFGRPDPGPMQIINLNDIIKSVVDASEPLLAKAGIKLECRCAAVPLYVRGNGEKIKQVFTNLVFNAIEAMRQNGTLTVHTRAGNEQAVVTVRDTGEGIPPEDLPNIFEPFYTKKASGSGLGLAICKRIIEIHGGAIDVRSQAGSGSEFTVRLPLTEKDVMPVE